MSSEFSGIKTAGDNRRRISPVYLPRTGSPLGHRSRSWRSQYFSSTGKWITKRFSWEGTGLGASVQQADFPRKRHVLPGGRGTEGCQRIWGRKHNCAGKLDRALSGSNEGEQWHKKLKTERLSQLLMCMQKLMTERDLHLEIRFIGTSRSSRKSSLSFVDVGAWA